MKIQHKKSRPFAQAILSAFVLAGAAYGTTALAADHRDSLAVDAIPEGDLADVFAYVDPANNSNVVLAMAVNPFTNPSEGPSVRFGQDLLYQFKIDNNQSNGAAEDTVIQINFHGGSNERAAQTYDVVIGTPSHTGPLNQRLYNARTLCSGTVFLGSANPTPTRAGAITSSSGTSCFAGLEDDSFQTDVAQAVFRIGLNPDPVANAANHSQDLFRGYAGTQSLIGGLRGRPLRLDGTSGVDGFGGYSTTSIVLSVPGNLLRGGGIRNVAKSGAVDSSLIGVWATVSRPTSETFNGFDATHGQDYAQFERMGQELFNTVFGFAKLPNGAKAAPLTYGETGLAPPAGASASTALSTAQIKDLINARGPETDVQLFDRLFPDSLTTTPTAGSASTGLGGLISALSGKLLGGNTVAGRASLLTVLGFNSLGITGTPLLLPQIGLSGNTNRRLLAQLSVPDYLRLNLDVATDGVRAGAATSGNDSATLGIAKWGIQNGRRPADDVTDIILRLNRELDDVQFPANVVLPGIADAIPGSSDLADRAALSCTQLDVAGGLLNNLSVGSLLGALDANGLQALLVKPGASDGLLGKYTLNILTPCEDARIFAVLQGTDWIESNPLDVINVANQVSDQRALDATFPYMGFNPVPGETGTNAFPPQK